MTTKYKRIVVKIGSNVLTRADGTIDATCMSHIVDQVAALRHKGVDVILVSSGAVASGRSEIKGIHKIDAVSSRQLYSAVGQVCLINKYYQLFRDYGIACGQVLTTKESFATRTHYLNQRNCMQVMLESGVVPIVNENDTISVTELMFTDNDELSGLVSAMMDAEALIILSNIDGIYNGDPHSESSSVIREIKVGEDISSYIQTVGSSFGRGGMRTKSRIASRVAEEGTEVIIANGKTRDILLSLVEGKDVICTRFIPAGKVASGVKKWIAHSESFAKGTLYINKGAYDALMGSEAVSLLPVGVERVEGYFEKDDIVRIMSDDGVQIGVGKISCDSTQASSMKGTHGARPFIHYDYLYIDTEKERINR